VNYLKQRGSKEFFTRVEYVRENDTLGNGSFYFESLISKSVSFPSVIHSDEVLFANNHV
jgi:hypothetical protein